VSSSAPDAPNLIEDMTVTGTSQGSALAEVRARRALTGAGLDAHTAMIRASSVTNEVWLTSDHVVRVNRASNQRLRREAVLGATLPAEVRYPPIVAYGGETGADWLVHERVPGMPLSRAWPGMSADERRQAIRQLGGMLAALHAWEPTVALSAVETPPQLLTAGSPGRAVAPVLDALAEASHLEHIDPVLLAEAAEIVEAGATALEPFTASTIIHGDLTFENVLWDGREITALLDFEWARVAPCDLELDILLRFCAYPFLHVAEDYEHLTKAEDYADVPWWLSDDHPALFDWARQIDRVRVYSVAYDVRELLAFPPPMSPRHLSPYHPYHRLTRLVKRRSYLDDLGRAMV
jgi:aminoglycoside phosphotransferase (APT) family kinase protein